MALQIVQAITKAGINPVLPTLIPADAAGDSVDAASGIFLTIENTDAGAHTVTVAAPVSTAKTPKYGALPVDDIVLSVAAGDIAYLAIPLGYSVLGQLSWTYDDVTGVNLGVFSITP